MSKGIPNNRQKDVARMLRQRNNNKDLSYKVFMAKPTKVQVAKHKGA